MSLTPEEGRDAVRLARECLDAHVRGGSMPSGDALSGVFSERRGVFVTLNLSQADGNPLRGCIGFPYPVMSLKRAIREATAAAAADDPRFPPVTRDELDSIVVEVSVLTQPSELVEADRAKLVSRVRVGIDGLIVSDEATSGLLLPQVATEFGLGPAEFLRQTCLKAGLPPDAWLLDETRVQVFQAEIFAEAKPHGPVSVVNPRGR